VGRESELGVAAPEAAVAGSVKQRVNPLCGEKSSFDVRLQQPRRPTDDCQVQLKSSSDTVSLSALEDQPRMWAAVLPLVAFLFASAEQARPGIGRIHDRTYYSPEARQTLTYAEYVPSSVVNSPASASASPLIVALHGLGDTPSHILRYPRFTKLADKYGYILVAPMGYNTRGWYGHEIPHAKRVAGDPPNLSQLSEADVLRVLALTKERHNIDAARVYLLGHSMGGGGVWHLAKSFPDMWAAIAPICPSPILWRTAADVHSIRHIPTILVQGSADKWIPPKAARAWAAALREAGAPHEYVEVRGGTHVTAAPAALPRIIDFFNRHKAANEWLRAERAK
jgi:poly(3-hydroxybutyrate) depolymerase